MLWSRLTSDDGASTLCRLFVSRHVADLQLIFWSSLILMLAGIVFIIIATAWITIDWPQMANLTLSTTLLGAVVGVGLGALAWTYQTGSARLGVVDLFACEVATICRVIAIADMASHLEQMYETPPSTPMKFESQEQYSPIFNSNSKDLEVLEARVVEPVAEFYTYLKAMRDYLRLLGTIERPQDDKVKWRTAVQNVTYMLLMMLESGRKTVGQLLEFDPEKAENTIMILLSELVSFKMLVEKFEMQYGEGPSSNARLERLRLRKKKYPSIVRAAYDSAKNHAEANSEDELERWQRAEALLGELDQTYHRVFGEWIAPQDAPARQVSPRAGHRRPLRDDG